MRWQWQPSLICATLCSALASDPIAELGRKLALRHLSEIPVACTEKCPGLSNVSDEYRKLEASTPSADANAYAGMKRKDIQDIFENAHNQVWAFACENKESFVCASKNACGSDWPGEVGIDCFCDQCPKLAAGIGGIAGYNIASFLEEDGKQPTEDEILELGCPLVKPTTCAKGSEVCRRALGTEATASLDLYIGIEQRCRQKGFKLDGTVRASAGLAFLGSLVMLSAVIG